LLRASIFTGEFHCGYANEMKKPVLVLLLILISNTAYSQILSKLIISNSGGINGNQSSLCPALSGDARFTTFESAASNLVSGDTNNRPDFFLYDNQEKTTKLLSKNADGTIQSGGDVIATCNSDISRDGKTAVYATFGAGITNDAVGNISRLYAFDIPAGTPQLLTPGNLTEGVFFPSISEDGSRIVFMSNDPLLVSNEEFQVFLLERPSNTITMLSVDKNGNPGNSSSTKASISHDGKWVAFPSKATNLNGAELTGSGGIYQVYLLNIQNGKHKLLSVSSDGTPGNKDSFGADISEKGNEVVFYTEANNLLAADTKTSADVVLYDKALNQLELVGLNSENARIKGSHELFDNSISADGNLVMFRSLLGYLDKFRIEVYVRDRKAKKTYLSSFDKSCDLGGGDGQSHSGSIAPDSNTVSFAVGKNTKSSPLQVLNVNLDVLQSISSAPASLDQPDADICADSATIAMTPYTQRTTLNYSTLSAKIDGVSYETSLKKEKTEVKKLTSKKNILTLNNLPPGNYSSSYRVKVSTGGTVTKSPFSAPVKFRIK
jgi:Tol biopolymer transport system component